MRDSCFDYLKFGVLVYLGLLVVWLVVLKPFAYNPDTYFHLPHIDFFIPFAFGFAFLAFWSLAHFLILIEDSDHFKHNLHVALLSGLGAFLCLLIFFGYILFTLS